MSITLLLDVPGTNLGIKAVLIEGEGVAKEAIPKLAIKSPAELVDLSKFKELGGFERDYRGSVFPGQAIQKVIDDLEGRGPVTHLVYCGAESQQIQDGFPVTFSFAAYESPN